MENNNREQNKDFKISVKLADYKGLEIKGNELKVEEFEIEDSLNYLRNSRAKIITVKKPAKRGDRVEIDFEVRHAGVKIEDGTSKNHPLILGENRFLPGFEEQLEGMSAGEEKTFSLKAPENWPDKRINNKNLDFKVKMNLVQEREIPELDDGFAKSLGNFNSLQELKNSIRSGILEEKTIKENQRIKLALIEKVAENSQIEFPKILVLNELERMIEEFRFSISAFGLDFNIYLKEIGKNIDELKKDWEKEAEKRVRVAICLQAIAEREKIVVDEEEIQERVNENLKHYYSIEEAKKDIDLEKLKNYTKEVLRNEKVLELLKKEAIII